MAFRLDHRFTQKNLSAYLDGQLTGREKERVERHLTECTRCQKDLATLRSTVELLHAVPSVPLPRSFTLPSSVEEERERYRFWRRTHRALRTTAALVSLLLVLLLSGDLAISQGLFSLRTTQEAPQKVEIAVEMPEAPQVEEERVPSLPPTPSRDEAEAAAEEEAAAAEKRVAGEVRPEQALTQTEEAVESEDQMLEMEPPPEAPESPTATATGTPSRRPEPTATIAPLPPRDHPPAEEDQPPVWRIWNWLRTGWIALSGLLLVLVAGVLWTWQKKRRLR